MPELRIENIGEALRTAYPELDAVRAASNEDAIYLVGGAVRDLLLGRGRADLDLVVVGDAAALATRLGGDPVEHERFATAKVRRDGHAVDIATARSESYPRPGALPEVEPAGDIETDLARRDFTINAMALPLQGEAALIDPHNGRGDLEAGLLRVLHESSFADDPTRALRAARYAARFGFAPAPQTATLIRSTDLDTVSADRQRAELLRLAAEPGAVRGLELLAEWGLVEPAPDGLALASKAAALISAKPWDLAEGRAQMILTIALRPVGRESELIEARPPSRSAAVELARRFDPPELVSARVRGADWLDDYVRDWAHVKLEIDGEDLIAAGIPQGPAVGHGLAVALRRKLDGEVAGREAELAVALEAARGTR